jgi:hypothetical protein
MTDQSPRTSSPRSSFRTKSATPGPVAASCRERASRRNRGPRDAKGGGAVKRRGDRGWAVRGGSTPARAFQRPHRAHRRTNSPTKCESSTDASNATGTGVQTLVAATIEMSSMRGRWWIGNWTHRHPDQVGRLLSIPPVGRCNASSRRQFSARRLHVEVAVAENRGRWLGARAELSDRQRLAVPRDQLALPPPAHRISSHTHSPARRTSAACPASALITGMRRNSLSSSNHALMLASLRDRYSSQLK